MVGDQDKQYVVFRLGAEEYALPIETVSSIIRYEEPTPVPRAPKEVQGVINLRGLVIPVVDLRMRFSGADDTEGVVFERIVVTESDLGSIGLAVDGASEVTEIPADAVSPAPETALTAETAEAFEGVAQLGDRLIILLRLEKAVPHEEYVRVASQEGEDDV